jgi:hypothetical protein
MYRVPSTTLRALPAVFSALMLALGAGCGGGADNGPDVPADAMHVSCLAKPDPGPCRAAKRAYYYDYKTDSCEPFIWGGCQGSVPFETMEQCLRMCKGER